MRNALAIFRFELTARRQVLLLAAAIGALILVAPFVPGLENQRPGDVREAASITFAIALGYGLAVALGATVFGSDLSEQRLGFYFARPVGGVSVWIGRMAAAWCLVVLAELIVLLPPVVAGAGVFEAAFTLGWWFIPAFMIGPTMVLLLAHALSVIARARTPWLVLDVIGLTAAGVVGWLALRTAVRWLSFEATIVVAGLFLAALTVALLLAGAAGTILGRTDLRRAHGALSLALWSVVAAGWAGTVAYANWLDDFGPADLRSVELADADPTGSWAAVGGRGEGRLGTYREFIVSATDGRWVALRQSRAWNRWWASRLEFSADGRTAVWSGEADRGEPRSLWRVDLAAPMLTPVETTITLTGNSELVLSPAGRRVAVRSEEGLLSVYDLAGEELVTMARLPKGELDPACVFPDDGFVRCYAVLNDGDDRRSLRIHELDIASGTLHLTGEIELAEGDTRPSFVAFSPSLLSESGCPGENCRLRFFDPRTGVLERDEPLPEWAGAAAVLADGRLVARSGREWGERALGLQDPQSGEWITHDLGQDVWTRVGGETSPGNLVIFRSRHGEEGEWIGEQVELLDLETGERRPVPGMDDNLAGYAFSQGRFWQTGNPMAWKPEAWRLFRDGARGIVRWDPETDTLTTIAGGAQ